MGARYLGSYIWNDESKREWLKYSTETCERNICMIRKTAGKYTQEHYDAVVHVIQLDWIFLQHISTNMVDAFAGVEKMIWKTFLPSIFFGKEKPSHQSEEL